MDRYLVIEVCEVKGQPELLFLDCAKCRPKIAGEFCSLCVVKCKETLAIEVGDVVTWDAEGVRIDHYFKTYDGRQGVTCSWARRVGALGPILANRPEGRHG